MDKMGNWEIFVNPLNLQKLKCKGRSPKCANAGLIDIYRIVFKKNYRFQN